MTLGVLFGLDAGGRVRWGREVIVFCFFDITCENENSRFSEIWGRFWEVLGVQIGEKFDLGEFAAMLFLFMLFFIDFVLFVEGCKP